MKQDPLTLKNADNKIIAGLINWCISPVVKACAISMQRGFVGDRQLLQNAVDLDQASRVAAHLYSAGDDACKFSEILFSRPDIDIGNVPVTVLWDYVAAFPSVAHAWLFLVLEAIKLPAGLLNVVRALYDDGDAFAEDNGAFILLFKMVPVRHSH